MNFNFVFSSCEEILLLIVFFLFIIQLYYILFYYASPQRYMNAAESGKITYNEECPPVSVIVYARNEAEYLSLYLPLILKQNYPVFDVIVVNDGSTDETKNIISELKSRYSNLYHTYIPDEARYLSRKKLALTLGIKAAKHDIVVLTNANCVPVTDMWLRSMTRNFVDNTDIVIGYSFFKKQKSWLYWYMSYDRLLFVLHYTSYALKKKPYMGLGDNLAYRKSLFFDNKGFSKHLNLHFGDDDLFINEVATRYNTRVEFVPESQLIAVHENNDDAWKEQKLRYNFTSKYLKSSAKWVFGFDSLSRYLFYIFNIALLWQGVYHNNGILLILPLLLICIRYVIQLLVLRRDASLFSSSKLFFIIPFFEVLQPIINLYYRLIGFLSRRKNYTWTFNNR